MHIKLIKSHADLTRVRERISKLMDKDLVAGSKESDELEVLALLAERYEQDQFPIDKPDPIEAIKFRMEQLGLLKKDLIPYIGSAPKVTEVLNRTRQLSLNMIRKLNTGLGIPVDTLVRVPNAKVTAKIPAPKKPTRKSSAAA